METSTPAPTATDGGAGPAPDHAIVIYSDIGCPWAHVLIHRLDRERRRLGLDREIAVDHRAFPLELVNRQPTPVDVLDEQVRVLSEIEPAAGWSTASDITSPYSASTLPALEAVQAAKEQSIALSVALDLVLRRAMFEDRACLAVHGVVLDIARSVEGLDIDRLWSTLAGQVPRGEVWHQFETAKNAHAIAASPTVMLPDGSTRSNPGFEMHWEDGPGSTLVIDVDDPDAVATLVEDAAALSSSD